MICKLHSRTHLYLCMVHRFMRYGGEMQVQTKDCVISEILPYYRLDIVGSPMLLSSCNE
jgi:hypothetical protein